MKKSRKTAGIVGAGIMGKLLAFYLIQAEWSVSIFDQDNNNCSQAAAGLLTPIAELEKSELIIFNLGLAALNQHWPEILKQLDNKIYFKNTGSLVISHPRDEGNLSRLISSISYKLRHENFYQKLDPAKINSLEPDLCKFNTAYYFQDEGQIDSQNLLLELERYLINKKVTWFKNTFISDISPGELRDFDQKKYSFDCVFDCRGLGAKENFKDLRGVRGELVWLYAPEVFISRPIRLLHPRYSLYLVPRPNQIYLVGASELETEDYSEISVRTVLELLTAVYSINAKFSEARVIKTISQCRPTLENHCPKIKYQEGLIAINGLYRHGFLIAPTLALEV